MESVSVVKLCIIPYFHRASFRETLEIDFQDYGPLIDPSIEKGLQGT